MGAIDTLSLPGMRNVVNVQDMLQPILSMQDRDPIDGQETCKQTSFALFFFASCFLAVSFVLFWGPNQAPATLKSGSTSFSRRADDSSILLIARFIL